MPLNCVGPGHGVTVVAAVTGTKGLAAGPKRLEGLLVALAGQERLVMAATLAVAAVR